MWLPYVMVDDPPLAPRPGCTESNVGVPEFRAFIPIIDESWQPQMFETTSAT
jgi:hypothetical protein